LRFGADGRGHEAEWHPCVSDGPWGRAVAGRCQQHSAFRCWTRKREPTCQQEDDGGHVHG
jgi:hypothetical protein